MESQTATQVITVTIYFASGLLVLLVYVAYLKRWCRRPQDLRNSSGGDDAEPAMGVAVAAPATMAEAEAARRRGQILEAMPFVVVGGSAQGNGDEEAADCSICLCKYEAGEEARVLPECSHMYHKACVDQWLVVFNGQRCPLCSAPVGSPAEKPQQRR